eukprot:gene6260-10268_t
MLIISVAVYIYNYEKTYSYAERDELFGFKILKVQTVTELSITTYFLKHIKTGAEYFHIKHPKDTNNFFSIGFRTPPRDHTGEPHILEHLILCGSKKFPVRDPFFMMLRRSMNTYLNAWTYYDKTLYLFSSQIQKDYFNLLDIYTDAVLFPLLTPIDFQQEAHRLEFKKDKSLTFKGVVYNEMKGSMSSSNDFIEVAKNKYLYSKSIYENNYGGDPSVIPNLTNENLRNFHSNYYRPCNAMVYSYGNFDLALQLEKLNEKFEAFLKAKNDSSNSCKSVVPPIEKFKKSKRISFSGPPDPIVADENKQTKFIIAYLTNHISNPFESLVMSMLSQLLLDNPRGALYKSLIASGIARDFFDFNGYQTDYSETHFTIGVSGISSNETKNIEKIIKNTLIDVSKRGFPKKDIEALLNQIELNFKSFSENFGMKLIDRFMPGWRHGGNPVDFLDTKNFKKIRKLAFGSLFQDKIKKYLLKNPHTIFLTFEPDQQFNKNLVEKEEEKLKEIEKKLSDLDRRNIQYNADMLKAHQEKTQNSDVLPKLHLEDIPKQLQNQVNYKIQKSQDIDIYQHFSETNGLIHVLLYKKINIPKKMLQFLPLFTSVLTKLGTKEYDHLEFSQEIELYTSGISSDFHIIPNLSNLEIKEIGFSISSSCLDFNLDKMIQLMYKIISSPRLNDVKVLKTLLDQESNSLVNSIVESGTFYSILFSSSFQTPVGEITEKLKGLTYIKFLNKLSNGTDINIISKELMSMSDLILTKNDFRVLITTEKSLMENATKSVVEIINKVPSGTPAKFETFEEFKKQEIQNYIKFDIQVNFCSQTMVTVPYLHEDYPYMLVLAALFRYKYLHSEIREKGGAYGSKSIQGKMGIFSFGTYRDPNTIRSINVFKDSIEKVCDGQFDENDIYEGKLQVFQSLDAPKVPETRIYSLFFEGISDEQKSNIRNSIFDVKKEKLIHCCKKHLLNKTTSKTIVGPKTKIDERILKNWNLIQ